MNTYLDPEGVDRKPWDLRKRAVPMHTWSGRVVYDSQRHYFKMRDAQRIMLRVQPPENEEEAGGMIGILRAMTIGMMDRLLPFLDYRQVESVYEFCITVLDYIFKIDASDEKLSGIARRIIASTADKVGLQVTIKK